MEDINVQFGRKLKQLRIENNLTQKELAAKVGLSLSYLHRVEKGYTTISIADMESVSRVLNVNPAMMLEFCNNQSVPMSPSV
jgi:transcriptional regulator with XRE-family HTH domain